MFTFKFLSRRGKLTLRITHLGYSNYISLKHPITSRQIRNNRVTVKNKDAINALIVSWEKRIHDLQTKTAGQTLTVKQIIARLRQPRGGIKLSDACERYCDRNIAFNTKKNYRIAVRDFIEVCEDLPVSAISHGNLYEFVQESLKVRSHNTVANRLKKLKAIWTDCENRGECSGDPFKRVTLSEKPGTNIALTAEQVKELASMEGLSKAQALARDVFMFQFYCQGMRISDALSVTHDNIQGDVLVYRAYKTGKLHRVPLFDAIRFPGDGWVPNDGSAKQIDRIRARLNKSLVAIGRRIGLPFRLTTHIARHTFASLAEKEASLATVQSILKHSNIAQTVAYMNSVRQEDHRDVSEKVLSKVKMV